MQENINIPDSNITTNLSFRQLVLMNMQQLTNFPYIEKDFDALTDYELLSLVVKFLNDVITNQNEQNASITRMYESFLALQTYVNNTKNTLEEAFNNLDNYVRYYFDNLDVQEEIDNKLDQMLEDGVLEQIIEQFIKSTAIWCFNTVADMQAATNLIDGSFAKTLGYYSVNDGGGATYKITDAESLTDYQEELNSGLYATLIIEDYVTPEMFGAYGDSTHDDSSSINKAIEFCETILLNNKTYLIESHIFINKPIKIIGKNNSRNLLTPTIYGENINELIFISSNTTGVILENFNIKSNYTRESEITTNGIYCSNNSYHLTFKNIQISNCKNGILVNRTWNLLFENCITDTCENGFNSADTVTSTSFISCVSYNCQRGWYIRGGFVYSAFYSCGVDHCDYGIRSTGSGSIDTYNFGAEDYVGVYSIASNNNGISLNIHNTFFYPSERKVREILMQGNNINIYDTNFPNNCDISSTVTVNYINCTNIPNTANSIVNNNPLNIIKKIENNKFGCYKGFKTQNANSTLTLQRNENEDCYIIGKLIVGTSAKVIEILISSLNTNHKVENPDTDLVTVSFNNYDMTITFLENCQVDFDLKYQNYK